MNESSEAVPLPRLGPYIVAELNTSHFGKVEVAKDMISNCKEIGVDCVKFQSWTEESLYASTYFKENPIAKRFFKKYSMGPDELREMAAFCRSIEIGFSSTPYSVEEVDFLIDECDADFLKIASMDLNNIPFLEYIASRHVNTIMSTGMGSMSEIERAVTVFEQAGHSKLCLLHCVSLYPCSLEDCNLNNISMFRDRFPAIKIGYSDHTKGPEAAVAAVALGAQVIEKHFTLDSSQIGMDNQMATEPDDFARMITYCRNAASAAGKWERELSDREVAQRLQMRRSAVAIKDLQAGEKLALNDIVFKRPGNGLAPDQIDPFLGRALKRDVEQGEVISLEDFED
jgi:N-acetylneuraminate synthase